MSNIYAWSFSDSRTWSATRFLARFSVAFPLSTFSMKNSPAYVKREVSSGMNCHAKTHTL